MWTNDNQDINDVSDRLDALQYNLELLEATAKQLMHESDDPFPYLSLTQAFHDELEVLEISKDAPPNEREAAINHTLSNMSTIRDDADEEAISQMDEAVEGLMKAV